MRKEPRGLAIAGLILSIIQGIFGLLVLGPVLALIGLGPAVKAESDTQSAIVRAHSEIKSYYQANGVLPSDEDGSLIAASINDGYGVPLRYKIDGESFYIISNGADKAPDTSDDRKRLIELK